MNAEQFNEALAKIEKERTVIINLYMQIIAVKEETIKDKDITINSLNKEIERLTSETNRKDNIW